MESSEIDFKQTLINDVIDEFDRILECDGPAESTEKIEECIEMSSHFHSHTLLQLVKEFVSKHDLLKLLLRDYNEARRQPSDEREVDVSSKNAYEFVQAKLNLWILQSKPPAQFDDLPPVEREGKIYKLLKWSAELWFFRHFFSCGDEVVKEWVRHHVTTKVFNKYFGPLEDDKSKNRFTLIASEDACDLLQELLRVESVENMFKELLKKLKKVFQLTKDGLSREMTQIVSKRSEKYYIIPKPKPNWKMYATHYYSQNTFYPDGKMVEFDPDWGKYISP